MNCQKVFDVLILHNTNMFDVIAITTTDDAVVMPSYRLVFVQSNVLDKMPQLTQLFKNYLLLDV